MTADECPAATGGAGRRWCGCPLFFLFSPLSGWPDFPFNNFSTTALRRSPLISLWLWRERVHHTLSLAT